MTGLLLPSALPEATKLESNSLPGHHLYLGIVKATNRFFSQGILAAKTEVEAGAIEIIDCLLPLRAGITLVPFPCARASYVAYLGCYLVTA